MNIGSHLLTSIRARIILLPFLGIIGMCLIVGVNLYTESSKTREMEVSRESQLIARSVLEVMMIEEGFINSSSEQLLKDYEDQRKSLSRAMSGISSISSDNNVLSLAEDIIRKEDEHAGVFTSMVANITHINKAREEMAGKFEQSNASVNKVIGSINYEETMLGMEGEFLDLSKAGLRMEIKDFLMFANERLLNIQNLFLFSDSDKYLEAGKDIEKRLKLSKNNIKILLTSIKSPEYDSEWKRVEEILPVTEKLEGSIYTAWGKNRELMAGLKQTGHDMQDAAAKIAALCKENVEEKGRTGGFISMVVAMSGILLLVVTAFIIYRAVTRPIANTVSMIKDIAEGQGDLTRRLEIKNKDEIGELAHWFNVFIGNLEDIISRVKLTAIQVDSATSEVSSGAQGLSQATQEQASAIEEVAATIEEMTSSIKQNAHNSGTGREMTEEMVKMAGTSRDVFKDLLQAMTGISGASKKIGDIVVTVNEVAFQTNLLALNAAVEAARAGEHGKGFAVVAEEVRALAQRSAQAAKEIKDLIGDTVDKIESGDKMVNEASDSLEGIISAIDAISQSIEEISASSNEQSTGVDELNRAIAQIDSTTQQNASTVEELASISDSLSNEAGYLASNVERFKVSDMDGAQEIQTSQARVDSSSLEIKTVDKNHKSDNDFEEF